jgi:sigma-E factor negative regulatory protein RseA
MSAFEKQSLSALLDGEADEIELRRVLRSSESDPELLQTWGRYNQVQAALHHETAFVPSGFSAQVAAQLESEAPLKRVSGISATVANLSTWQKGIAKMAIAASVALVFLVSLDDIASPAFEAPMVAGDAATASEAVVIATSEPVIMDPEAAKRLSDYISATVIDEDEPVRLEHIQDSPLYRLVNRLQEKP